MFVYRVLVDSNLLPATIQCMHVCAFACTHTHGDAQLAFPHIYMTPFFLL